MFPCPPKQKNRGVVPFLWYGKYWGGDILEYKWDNISGQFLPCLTTPQCVVGVIVQKSIMFHPEKPPIDKIENQESQSSREMLRRKR